MPLALFADGRIRQCWRTVDGDILHELRLIPSKLSVPLYVQSVVERLCGD